MHTTHRSLITAAAAAAERAYEANCALYGERTAQRLYGETLRCKVADAGISRASDIIAAAQAAGNAAYDAVYAAAGVDQDNGTDKVWDDAVDALSAAYAARLAAAGWTAERAADVHRRRRAAAAAAAVLDACAGVPADTAYRQAAIAYRYARQR